MKEASNKQENREQQNDQVSPDQPVEGRLYDSRNPEFRQMDGKNDISHVDEQEGEMNNGTTAMPGERDHQEGKQDHR